MTIDERNDLAEGIGRGCLALLALVFVLLSAIYWAAF
jgi:hypothetical protein